MNQYALPVIQINEMQKLYAATLKQEYREILNMHMTELIVLNYAHHVRNNDTYILRRAVHNIEHNHKMKQVSMFYISKTNLYSRPSNPASYRFANIAAYKNREYPVTIAGFEHDDDYHMRLLYEYTSIDFVN